MGKQVPPHDDSALRILRTMSRKNLLVTLENGLSEWAAKAVADLIQGATPPPEPRP